MDKIRLAELVHPGVSLENALQKNELGKPIAAKHIYGIPYMDNTRRVPKDGFLRLHPRMAADMWGRTAAKVFVQVGAEGTLDEQQQMLEDRVDYQVGAVYELVKQNNSFASLISTLEPRTIQYFRLGAHSIPASSFIPSVRESLKKHLTTAEGVSSGLQGFLKRAVNVVKYDGEVTFQVRLPTVTEAKRWGISLPENPLELTGYAPTEVKNGVGGLELSLTYYHTDYVTVNQRARARNDPPVGIDVAFKRYQLQPEQAYMEKAGTMVHLRNASTTCAEKKKILKDEVGEDWLKESIMAAHYGRLEDGKYIALVGSMMDEVNTPEICKMLGYDATFNQESIPEEMERGTCTPFVGKSGNLIERMIFLQLSDDIMQRDADYSVGGFGPSAHRASMHISPRQVEQIMIQHLGPQRVLRAQHPSYSRELGAVKYC